jgi:hypothetical protein
MWLKKFNVCYGTACMDECADITTAKFRDNEPKSVWVDDTWKALRQMKYEKLNSSVIDSKIENGKALVILNPAINTKAGKTTQKDVYFLSRKGDMWLIDEQIVTDEEVDVEKLAL